MRIDDLIDSNQYKRNRAVYSEIRARYSTLVDERDDIEYRINLSLESIDEAKRELDRHVDLDLSRRFYEEIASDYPNLEKSFEDMTRFNQKLA
ncbi:MAG: DUF2326 domain-containing protein, partial [Atopobium sp.]|nr:DUF2326 domain-containing protein [Atopobium sp.]